MPTLAHPWSRKQRRLIVASTAVALALLAAAIYGYERYYRGPGEEAFYGTWVDPMFDMDEPEYWEFRPDQTFAIVSVISGAKWTIVEGRWYAGGPNLYFRFPAEFIGPSRPSVMRIVDVSSDEFTVRFPGQSRVYLFRRATLDSRHASNQAMERTPDRHPIHF